MNIQIKETGEIKKLSITDPKTGIDFAGDFVGNNWTGTERTDDGTVVMSRDDYKWWQDRIAAETETETLIANYRDLYGDEEVDFVLSKVVDYSDFGEIPASVRHGLAQLDN